jgi:hypothetical protein
LHRSPKQEDQQKGAEAIFFITTFRNKPNLSPVEKGKRTRAFKALRAPSNNPLYQGSQRPLTPPAPRWTAIYMTENRAHGVIIINTDEGGPDADAGPGPAIEWLNDIKTKFIQWVDFDETHRMDRFDQPADRALGQQVPDDFRGPIDWTIR